MLLTCPAVMLLPGECWKRREWCRSRAEISKRWRLAHPEKYRESVRKQNSKKRRTAKSSYHRFKTTQAKRRWRASLPPEKRAEYLRRHRDRLRAWKQRNRKRYLDRRRRWERIAVDRDPIFRLVRAVRTRILRGLQGTPKSDKTEEILGCSFYFLRRWLESKFQPGMTWENQGLKGWHIDHIRPCASFDLTDPEQQKLCFHYTNLQPLWAKDNLSKGAKILDTCGPSDKGVCATVESHGQLLERAALESL
jgi:hypothetical protein